MSDEQETDPLTRIGPVDFKTWADFDKWWKVQGLGGENASSLKDGQLSDLGQASHPRYGPYSAPFAGIAHPLEFPETNSGLGGERTAYTKRARSSRKPRPSKLNSATSSQTASTKPKKPRQQRGSACNPCNRASKKCVRDPTKPPGSKCDRCKTEAECFTDTNLYVDKATHSRRFRKGDSHGSGSPPGERASTALCHTDQTPERSPVQFSRNGMSLEEMNRNMAAHLAISRSQFQGQDGANEYNDDQVEQPTEPPL